MSVSVNASARFWRQLIVDLSVMTVVGLVLGFLGPFGSFADPLVVRLSYWLGLSFAGYACYRPVSFAVLWTGQKLDLPESGLWIAACLLATVPMTAIVWSLGFLARPFQWPSPEQALGTYGSVLLIGSGITVLFHLLGRKAPAVAKGTTPAVPAAAEAAGSVASAPVRTAAFLDRLPPELGSDLLALEMEDHYVRAHTALGSDLVLLRLRDAMAELGAIEGAQIHRSWWVARGAVENVTRDGRNVRLVLTGGLEAPVSRANVTILKDAGWI